MRGNTKGTTHFLNVDLDLYSKSNLQPLVTAMGEKVHVLYVGRHKRTYCAHIELASYFKNPDSTIRGFCALIRTLPKAPRKLWNTAKVRDLNIGVQAAMQPYWYEIALAPRTVNAASEVNARIVLTIYAPQARRDGIRDVTRGSSKSSRSILVRRR